MMTNHLGNETSPYLRQHQENPVDWYPWGEEAIRRARVEKKPIFLSIGYSACHWCHVMAHESFEDPQTAQYLNDHFINIKVDREERPDLDDIYMQAVVMLTGRGGWPMSIFLTPDLQPFYGGTYFPATPRFGMSSFLEVLQGIVNAWYHKPVDVEKSAQSLNDAIAAQQAVPPSMPSTLDLSNSVAALSNTYDWDNGGWGQAPKFPQPMVLQFLAQRGQAGDKKALQMMEDALIKMAQGGMYDHVGGGFHRYSTDAKWLVPHFEKMLYDNAQLALTYLTGFLLTRNQTYQSIAIQTLEFIQREMTNADGGFISSLDADTIDGEGLYYAWQKQELDDALNVEEFALLDQLFEINEKGNFEDRRILLRYRSGDNSMGHVNKGGFDPQRKDLDAIFSKLRQVRHQRPNPGKDDKVITEWNAYAIEAFARAGASLQRKDFIQTARKATDFILTHLQPERGQLQRTWNDSKVNHAGTLADYSALILALHAVYELDFSPSVYQAMLTFFGTLREKFLSNQTLFFDTAEDVPNLITRPRNLQDNATPSGNALAAKVHWVIGNYEHDPAILDQFTQILAPLQSQMSQYPTSSGFWLQCADLARYPGQQIALVSSYTLQSLMPFINLYHSEFRPRSVLGANFAGISLDESPPPLLDSRPAISSLPTAYVCENFTCHTPVTDLKTFQELVGDKKEIQN